VIGTAPWSWMASRISPSAEALGARTSMRAWLVSSCRWPIWISLMTYVPPCVRISSSTLGSSSESMMWPLISTSSTKLGVALIVPLRGWASASL
jgi:hypothetical protein